MASTGRPGGSRPVGRRTVTTGLLSALALGVAGCTPSGPGRDGASERPKPTPTQTPAPTPDPEPVRWPLTGVLVEGDLPERPALSVKVENSAAARPQSGLEDADLVWEEMVEGGTTRFNAAFHSVVPEAVGPVRSIRPMDAAMAAPLGGLLAFSGGQRPYIDRARDAGLQVISDDGGDPGFYRVDRRASPHNLYASGQDLLDQANPSRTPPPADLFDFADDADGATAVEQGEPTQTVSLHFPSSNPGWTWQPDASPGHGAATGAWRRSEDGVAQESEDGDPLLATNVVVLRVRVMMTDQRDASGARVPETILEGEGDGIVFSHGRAVEIAWAKGGDADPLRITHGGEPVLLAPGTTWIELLPLERASLAY